MGLSVAEGWYAAGKTLGLAVDLEASSLLVAVGKGAGDSPETGPEWRPAYQTGVATGATVGSGLFPAISGYGGARVMCNFGCDPSRPMLLRPPSEDYIPVGALNQVRVALIQLHAIGA